MGLSVVHIVRRYGLVGGMETYVWRLTLGLAERGFHVTVVCEQVIGSYHPAIKVVKLGVMGARHRWQGMQHFRWKVENFLRERVCLTTVLIHSHERSISHHVTTIHGSLMKLSLFERYVWCSRRVRAWVEMEREELMGSNVKMILPVSSLLKDELTTKYPLLQHEKLKIAWPGVLQPAASRLRMPLAYNRNSKITGRRLKILFVGKEWKRKGLDIAMQTVEQLIEANDNVRLIVKGPSQQELSRHMKIPRWMEVQGWDFEIDWPSYDLLLHPARQEPFGMVVAEARAHGLPVVVSKNVGALDLPLDDVWALPLAAPIDRWAAAVMDAFQQARRIPQIEWTWADVTSFYIDNVYSQVSLRGHEIR